MRGSFRLMAAAAGLALLVAGCTPGPAEESTELQVFAAASLREPFEEIGAQFEAEHEGVEVAFNIAGSSTLAGQILQGAPADVFASADPATMDRIGEAGLQGAAPVDFASNTLMIAVPPGNPAEVTDLASLTEDGLDLVVCAPEVPCGAAAATLEEAAGLRFAPVSEEQSVTDVLNKVTSSEADAGLVYATDVRTAGAAVQGIEVPLAQAAVNVYPITTVEGTDDPDLAQDFVDLVTGPQGQAILAGYGFGRP